MGRNRHHQFFGALALGVCYFALAKVGYLFVFFPEPAATFWPPSGLTLALFLRSDRKKWPAYIAAVFIAEMLISLQYGIPWQVTVAWSIADSLEGVLAALFVQRIVGPKFDILRLKDVGALLASALLTPIPCAFLATAGAAYWLHATAFWDEMRTWWFSVSLGEIVVSPFLLVWVWGERKKWSGKAIAEGAFLLIILGLLTQFVFGRVVSHSQETFVPPYLIFPFLLWAVLRFEEHGATAALLVLNSIAAYHTSRGSGPFASFSNSPLERMVALQAYISYATLSSLVLAAAFGERRKHITDLSSSISLLDTTIESSADAIIAIDLKGIPQRYNQRFLDVFRFPPEIVAANDLSRALAYSSAQLKNSEQNLARVHEAFARPDVEYQDTIEFKDGRVYERYSRPRRLNGQVVGRVVSYRDVTFRTRVTAELTDLTSRLSNIITSVSDYLWSATVDSSGKFTFNYSSPVLEKITGRAREYFAIGPEGWASIVHPDDSARFREFQGRALRAEVDQAESDYRIVMPDGAIRWVRDSVVAKKLEEGAIRLDGIISDITERKLSSEARERVLAQETLARREAEHAIQLRDDFLSIAAHELRTPLTPIRMNLQLVRHHVEMVSRDVPKVEFLRKAVDGTHREFERFLKLVENLLDVSRISAGRLLLDIQDIDLSELVRSVIERFDQEFKRAGCDLRFDIAEPVRGRWDQGRIEQVVINLLTNAMKYGGQKPIEISVLGFEGKALVRIRDQGIGIVEQDQEKIFRRFERVASIKHFGGFGLGLFISQEIVEAHGGRIRLESKPGVGSTFTIELPLL